MRVIFLQDVPNVANAGDVANVADGYARNYLIPKQIATIATAEGMKRIERITRAGNERRVRETQQLEQLASLIEGTEVTVKARATPVGEFYGAITPGQIADELTIVTGRAIDRKLVDVMEPIREPGEYEVVLHLAQGIQAVVFITAVVEE